MIKCLDHHTFVFFVWFSDIFFFYLFQFVLFAIFVETFQMGKIHKDIAMFMVEAAKNEEYNDQTLVKVRSNSELPPACLT